MRLIAELTMPNNNSWNGRWSGDKDKFTKVFTKTDSKKNREFIGNYYYNFGDGWGANVEIREALPREKVTNKFCGYNWMITSIKVHKDIRI
ncbi:MAG: hypothetical protein GY714_18185 [Desulfobacterales bacterium]|nr:hypothetical protein [Desulfobacterales bacterium]